MGWTSVSLWWLTVIALPVLLWGAWRGRSQFDESRIFELFRLSRDEYELVSCDMGGRSPTLLVNNGSVRGNPDAIFRHRQTRHFYVGEYKSRGFRGRMFPRELYQVTLAMGVLRERYNVNVEGGVAYGNGKVLRVHFNKELYQQLLAMVPEMRRARSRWKVIDPTPLRERHLWRP